MNEVVNKFLKIIFDFLASIKLAVILIVVFGILLSVATVLESKYSTEYAQNAVYGTMWFDLFLFILGLNVTCSALSRLPWKKRHTGFVVTHLGIIIILLGSMITRKMGIEGQIMLQEGESTEVMRVTEDVFSVHVPRQNVSEQFVPWFMNQDIPDGSEVKYEIGDTGITCYITDYLFNPQTFMRVNNNGPEGNAAVQIGLHRPGSNRNELEEWLFVNSPRQSTLELTIATIKFHRVHSEEELNGWLNKPQDEAVEEISGPQGQLVIKDAEGIVVHQLDVQDILNQPYTFVHQGDTYAVKFEEFIPRAYVRDNKLVNLEQNPINPTIRFEISGPFGQEEHLSFAKFPEFGSLHGQNNTTSGFQVEFQYPMHESSENTPKKNQMDLLLAPDGTIHYRTTNTGGAWQTGTLSEGESVPTTWNNLQLKLNKFYPNAKQEQEIFDAGKGSPGQHNNPAIAYRIEYNGDEQSGYLQYNGRKDAAVGGERVLMNFGQRRYPVGFEMELIDFRAPVYPGTTRPQRFESDVLVRAPEIEGGEMKTKIHMNHPLYHGKFTVYQSSYIKGQNGQPDISIFSVAYAPGTWVIYLGSIVMCGGMLLMFFTTQYSSINYKKYKLREESYMKKESTP